MSLIVSSHVPQEQQIKQKETSRDAGARSVRAAILLRVLHRMILLEDEQQQEAAPPLSHSAWPGLHRYTAVAAYRLFSSHTT